MPIGNLLFLHKTEIIFVLILKLKRNHLRIFFQDIFLFITLIVNELLDVSDRDFREKLKKLVKLLFSNSFTLIVHVINVLLAVKVNANRRFALRFGMRAGFLA